MSSARQHGLRVKRSPVGIHRRNLQGEADTVPWPLEWADAELVLWDAGAHFTYHSCAFQILLASLPSSGCCFLKSFWRLTPSPPKYTWLHFTIALTSNPHANDFLFTPWGPLNAYVCVTQEDGRLNVLRSTALTTRWIISSTLVIPPLYMVLRWPSSKAM